MKPYESYKGTNIPWISEMPSHWEQYRLGNIFSENKVLNTQLTEINALQFKFGEIIQKKKFQLDEELKKTIVKYTIVEPNHIMINGLNLNYDFITQRVGRVKEKGIITSAYIALIPKKGINPQFYTFMLKTYDSMKIFNGMGSGIRLTLDFQELKKTQVPVPPHTEQDQIVRFLDWKLSKINKLIKAKKKQIALLNEQKQATINKAVTKGLDDTVPMKDSGVEWIGNIPNNWIVRKLGTFSTTQNGISEAGDFFTAGDPFVSYGDVYKNYELPNYVDGFAKSNEEQKETYSVLRGDIFFTRTSETIEEIAFSSVCNKTIKNAIFSGFLIRVRPDENIIDTNYSKYYFRNSLLRNYFVKEMNLVTRASLSQRLLKNLPVLLPDNSTQIEIASHLKNLLGKIDASIQKIQIGIEYISEYKTSLISSVVTGKIDVRDVVVPGFEEEDEVIEDEAEISDDAIKVSEVDE